MIRVLDLEVTPVGETTLDALMEFHRYGLQGSVASASFLNTPLEMQDGYWILETPFVVGHGQIEVEDLNGTVHTFDCIIHPDSTKISHRRDWDQMLRDLYHWWGSYPGTQPVRDGCVTIGNHFSILILEGMINELTTWSQVATHEIQSWLQQYHTRYRYKDLSTLSVHELVLAQHSGRFQKILSAKDERPQIQVLERLSNEFHPIAFHIQYLLHSVGAMVRHLEEYLSVMSKIYPFQDKCRALQRVREQLMPMTQGKQVMHSMLSSIQYRDCPVVVQQFISQGELFLRHQMDLSESDGSIMQPHSYQVYELWCFYRLIRLCSESIQVVPTYTNIGNSSGWGMCVQFDLQNDVLELLYNPRFESYWSRKGSTEYSLIGEQRPDIVIRSRTQWCVLDVKYRTGLHNVLDSFSTAFAYLESLKDMKRGGHPTHSILLMPQPDEQTKIWFSEDFIQTHHFGCLHFNPLVFLDIKDLAVPWLLELVRRISEGEYD